MKLTRIFQLGNLAIAVIADPNTARKFASEFTFQDLSALERRVNCIQSFGGILKEHLPSIHAIQAALDANPGHTCNRALGSLTNFVTVVEIKEQNLEQEVKLGDGMRLDACKDRSSRVLFLPSLRRAMEEAEESAKAWLASIDSAKKATQNVRNACPNNVSTGLFGSEYEYIKELLDAAVFFDYENGLGTMKWMDKEGREMTLEQLGMFHHAVGNEGASKVASKGAEKGAEGTVEKEL